MREKKRTDEKRREEKRREEKRREEKRREEKRRGIECEIEIHQTSATFSLFQ